MDNARNYPDAADAVARLHPQSHLVLWLRQASVTLAHRYLETSRLRRPTTGAGGGRLAGAGGVFTGLGGGGGFFSAVGVFVGALWGVEPTFVGALCGDLVGGLCGALCGFGGL